MSAQKSMNTLNDKLAFSIPDVARVTGLGQTSLYHAIKAGHLRAVKYGTRTVIRREDLEAFLKTLTPITPREAAERDKIGG